MDSDSDFDYADDLEDYHCGDDAVEEEDEAADCSGDFDTEEIEIPRQNYAILTEADICRRQNDDVAAISAVFSVSKSSATLLLCSYNWSVEKLHNEWFADEENVRKAVGLPENPHQQQQQQQQKQIPKKRRKIVNCSICFEDYPQNNLLKTAACAHQFCVTCWTSYVVTAINAGPGCLTLQCPDPRCAAAVVQDMVFSLASEEEKEKYSRFLIQSYIDSNRTIKWCPAPGCEFAVKFNDVEEGRMSNYDVICDCSFSFCWNCKEDAHRPVDCDTVAKWISKNSDEAENTRWILAYSKPCPKCKRPIEKNHGCMHMTCRAPCRFQFCWLCLQPWGNHISCNRYGSNTQAQHEEEQQREMAKKCLVRYAHYYERWAANEKSRLKAMADLERMKTVDMEKLRVMHCQSLAQMKFVTEAWSQIVECRRFLKWTYAYGYYLLEKQDDSTKRQLFEYLQGEAEAGLERLHHCAEKELNVYLYADEPSKGFNGFRSKLAGLTCVTRNYFENLVRGLENGLSDVESRATTSRSSGGSSSSRNNMINDGEFWNCKRCTYANVKMAKVCEMCVSGKLP